MARTGFSSLFEPGATFGVLRGYGGPQPKIPAVGGGAKPEMTAARARTKLNMTATEGFAKQLQESKKKNEGNTGGGGES